MIGNVVELKVPCLGNNAGTRGVVFNEYDGGIQVIFENGNFDGFCDKECEEYLEDLQQVYVPFYIRDYKFKNVMKVSQDFEKGFWGDVLN